MPVHEKSTDSPVINLTSESKGRKNDYLGAHHFSFPVTDHTLVTQKTVLAMTLSSNVITTVLDYLFNRKINLIK